MNQEKLTGALQENVLTLLVYSDTAAKLIQAAVRPEDFESSIFRDIVSHALDYLERFGAPIKEHLPDELEHVLNDPEDPRRAAAYKRVLENLHAARESMQESYVISKLHTFVRQQRLKKSVVEVVRMLGDGQIDEAEVELESALKQKLTVFDPGTLFSDPTQSLKFFDRPSNPIHTGVRELDQRGIGPAPQEMFLVMAAAKRGKTWGLVHLGKFCILQRYATVHVTLEMSEDRVSQRYVQSFFSISKRQSLLKIPEFRRDELGRLIDIDLVELERPTFADPNSRAQVAKDLKRRFTRRPPLIIKQFPTGQLTIHALEAYLDSLERMHRFNPQVLILDYPDLMALKGDIREATGQLYKDLRGIAVERNLALIAATQGNRASAEARTVEDYMVAEDWSKIATADNVITYSQTKQEKALGLARLFVSNGRNDEDRFTVLIAQSYAIGQFCLDSTFLLSDYWKIVDRKNGKPEEKDDD